MSERRKGALLAYVQIFLNIAIALVFTPILVTSLGQSGYGLFSIIGSLAAYLMIMDLGMNDAIIRNVVRLRSTEGPGVADEFVGSMLSAYAVLALAVMAGGLLLSLLLDEIFGAAIGPADVAVLREMLLVMTACLAVSISLNPIGALLVAAERFVFLRGLEMVVHLVATAVIVMLLFQGFGAVMVVACTGATLVATAFAKLMYARGALGAVVRFRPVRWASLRPILLYSAPIFLSIVIEQIYWKLDNVLIGAMLGAAAVAVYAIGITFNKYFMSFATAISRVMIPEIIRRVDADATPRELTALLVGVSRLQAVVVLWILTGLVAFGAEFIRLWVGAEYALSYVVMLLVLCPYALELIGNVRNVLLQVRDLYWYRVGIVGSMALLNVPLTIWWLREFGVVGAAASSGVCIFIGYVGLAAVMQRKVGIHFAEYIGGVARGVFPVAVACMVLGLVAGASAGQGWAALALKIAVYTGVYATAMWFFGLDRDEKTLVRSTFVSLRRRGDGK